MGLWTSRKHPSPEAQQAVEEGDRLQAEPSLEQVNQESRGNCLPPFQHAVNHRRRSTLRVPQTRTTSAAVDGEMVAQRIEQPTIDKMKGIYVSEESYG